MRLLAVLILLAATVGCSSFKGIEHQQIGTRSDVPVNIERTELAGITVYEDAQEIKTQEQLDQENAAIIAEAKAKAKAATVMFDIQTKQSREQIKQDTAKYLSWICFGLAIASVVLGIITKGYAQWACIAGCFTACGAFALNLPEFCDYIRWAALAVLIIALIKGMSHTKSFSVFRR